LGIKHNLHSFGFLLFLVAGFKAINISYIAIDIFAQQEHLHICRLSD